MRSGLPASVSDARANKNEIIAHAVEVLGKSEHRRLVFEAIYYRKKRKKTLTEIAEASGLPLQRVRQEALRLESQQIIGKSRENGQLVYIQDPFVMAQKAAILKCVKDPRALEKLPTKRQKRTVVRTERVAFQTGRAVHITVDDVASFERVRGVASCALSTQLSEADFKYGIQRILQEEGEFKDWGGEISDVFTTKLKINTRRLRAAFAFKGPAKKGKLRVGMMGKAGDQIQRLFRSPADVFLVQYHGQVAEDVQEQMEAFASKKAAEEKRTIHFGVIDGQDSARLIEAYSDAFTPGDNDGGKDSEAAN